MNVFVPKGIVPVHIFDVYDTILDANKMGQKATDDYRGLAERTGIASDVATKVVADYEALIRKEPWTQGPIKVEIIQALQRPLDQAGIKKSFDGCFLEDGIYVMRQILDSGEGVSIFSSGNNDDMRQALPEDIARRAGRFYDASTFTYPTRERKRSKAEAGAFVELVGLENALGRQVVSHTADELSELIAAVKSGAIPVQNLVYANRNNTDHYEVLEAGVQIDVKDLREVPYTKMVQREK